jgi:ferritin-like metal-binding protein YciE
MQETGFTEQQLADELSFEAFRQTVISDYTIAFQSRQASLLGRKKATSLLKGILNEEKDSKKSLKKLARSKSNHEAMAEPADAGR